MKAAQVVEYNQHPPYTVQETKDLEPGPNEILVQIKAAGFCHTDSMVFEGKSPMPVDHLPLTGSHEPAGVIAKLGSSVPASFKKGDRVGAVSFLGVCGNCHECKNLDEKFCRNLKGALGVTHDGGFAEYCLVDYHSTAKIPEDLAFEQAAPLCCAGTTIYTAILKAAKVADLKKGSSIIGIIGLGALGLLGVQMAKALGYKVVGVDARDQPLHLAEQIERKELRADLLIQTSKDTKGALKEIEKLDPNKAFAGLDAVIVATDAPPSFRYAADLLAMHGTFLLLGQPEDGIKFSYHDFIFKNLTVVGSLLGNGKDLQDCFNLCAKHGIKSAVNTYSLDDINKAVEASHSPSRKGKTVIVI